MGRQGSVEALAPRRPVVKVGTGMQTSRCTSLERELAAARHGTPPEEGRGHSRSVHCLPHLIGVIGRGCQTKSSSSSLLHPPPRCTCPLREEIVIFLVGPGDARLHLYSTRHRAQKLPLVAR